MGVVTFKGHKLVTVISETQAGNDVTLEMIDPAVLHDRLKELRRSGRHFHLQDHPTEKSPMGYPVMCYGKAGGCSHCVRCIMDYYKEEIGVRRPKK